MAWKNLSAELEELFADDRAGQEEAALAVRRDLNRAYKNEWYARTHGKAKAVPAPVEPKAVRVLATPAELAERKRARAKRRYAAREGVAEGRAARANRNGQIRALKGMGLAGVDIARLLGVSCSKVSLTG